MNIEKIRKYMKTYGYYQFIGVIMGAWIDIQIFKFNGFKTNIIAVIFAAIFVLFVMYFVCYNYIFKYKEDEDEECLSEEDFHKKRIMFFVLNGKLIFICNDTRSHKQWLDDIYNNYDYNIIVRGYVYNGTISIYTHGDNFLPVADKNELISIVNLLVRHDVIDSKDLYEYSIENGKIIGDVGTIWQPKEVYTYDGLFKY